MGKKSRRKAKLRAAARMAQRAPVQPVQQARPMAAQIAKPVAETKAAMPSIQSGSTAQADRYQYVVPELRQIAIVVGSLFVILFILALILH
jgi:protein-L-isoaspartate(D-aspartate) O-methyltransferase